MFMKSLISSKALIYMVILSMLLVPSIFLISQQAFGYGGGGSVYVAPSQPTAEPEPEPTAEPEPAAEPESEPTAETLYADELPTTPEQTDEEKEDTGRELFNRLTGTEPTTESDSKTVNFIAYGTPNTQILGAGERAGVVNSFKAAFNRMPASDLDWQDAVKIANGRWPNQRSQVAEDRSKISFRTIYRREPDMSHPFDNAAVTVMAYGLRPSNRNLNSERAAITIFRNIFGYHPSTATNWDAVRAIAYSGATR